MSDNIVKMPAGWGVFETAWGSYVTDRKNKVTNIAFKPDGQSINTEKLNIIVHDNGIEFVNQKEV